MAVPASGELKLWDTLWNQELGGSQGENSLHSASVYAGFTTPDALSDFYGWSDVEAPTMNTVGLISCTYNSACVRGQVVANGNENPTVGFYLGTSPSYASNTKYTLGTCGVGCYCQNVPGLSQRTCYRFRAWGCNSGGEGVAPNQCGFCTGEQPFTAALLSPNSGADAYTSPQGGHAAGSTYWVNPYGGSNNSTGGGGGTYYQSDFSWGFQHSSNTSNRLYASGRGQFLLVSAGMRPGYTYSRQGGGNPGGFANGLYVCCEGGVITTSWGAFQQWQASSDVRLKTNITYL